jgi:hypothetical protein
MYGNSKSMSNHVGDILFMIQNRPIIIFEKVNDPASIVKLVRSLMGV